MNHPQFLLAIRRVGLHCQETASASPEIFRDLLRRDLLLGESSSSSSSTDDDSSLDQIAATIVELYVQSTSPELTLDDRMAIREHLDDFLQEFRQLENNLSSLSTVSRVVRSPLHEKFPQQHDGPGIAPEGIATAVVGGTACTIPAQECSSHKNRQWEEESPTAGRVALSVSGPCSGPPAGKKPRHDNNKKKEEAAVPIINHNTAKAAPATAPYMPTRSRSVEKQQKWSTNGTTRHHRDLQLHNNNNIACAPSTSPRGSAVTWSDIKHCHRARYITSHHLQYLVCRDSNNRNDVWCELCHIRVAMFNAPEHLLGKKHTLNDQKHLERRQQQNQQPRIQQLHQATTPSTTTISTSVGYSVLPTSNNDGVVPSKSITTMVTANPPSLPSPPSYGAAKSDTESVLPKSSVSPDGSLIVPVMTRSPPTRSALSLFDEKTEHNVKIPDLQKLERRQDEAFILLQNDPQPDPLHPSQFARTFLARPSTTVLIKTRRMDASLRRLFATRWARWEPYWELVRFVRGGVTSPIRSTFPNVATLNAVHSAAEVTFQVSRCSVGDSFYGPLMEQCGKIKADHLQQQPADGDLELALCMMSLAPDPARPEKGHVWPKGTFLQFNGSPVKLKQRYYERVSKKWTGNSGAFLHLLPSMRQPLDVQKVSLACADTGDFMVAVLLCRYRGNTRLYESILSDLPKLSVADGRTKAKALIRADEDVSDELHVRLTCPLTKRLLQIPVRGKSCRHFQCFDLQSFIESNTVVGHNRWRCSVCEHRFSVYDLELCCFTRSLLAKASTERNLVKIDKNGNYRILSLTEESSRAAATANVIRPATAANIVEIL